MIYPSDSTTRPEMLVRGAAPAGGLGAIRFQSRPEAVAEQLRNAILTGSLKPGERLVEKKLASHFGIGQPTLREALKDLELQGFVRRTSQKHTLVTRLSKEDYRKMLEVRLAMEPLAIGAAAGNLNAETTRRLEECVRAMESAAEKLDLVTFHQNDLQFHRTIWDLAGNEHLTAALERVSFALFAFVLVEWIGQDGAEFRGSARQHWQILEGLRSGDSATARQVFLNSTLWFWREYHGVVLGKSCDQEIPEASGVIGGHDLPDPGLCQKKTDLRPLNMLQGRDLES